MKRINDPFIANFPSIDIHGYDRFYAVLKVKEFLNDCYKTGFFDLIVIHGKGEYILKKAVHEYLKTEKLVIEFKTHNLNEGMTVVKLKRF